MSKDRRYLLVAVLTVISAGSFYIASQDEPAELLSVRPAIHEFGKVQQGETLRYTVTLTNTSKSSLEFGEAMGSCKCVVANKLNGRVLSPGAAIEVPVTWDITGNRGQANADMVFDYYKLFDSHNRSRKLFSAFRAYADVEPEYFITPERIEFVEGQPEEKIIRLERNSDSTGMLESDSDLQIVDFGSSHVAVTLRKIRSEQNQSDTVLVTFDPDLWNRNATLSNLSKLKIDLVVNSEHEPRFVVPVDVLPAVDSN